MNIIFQTSCVLLEYAMSLNYVNISLKLCVSIIILYHINGRMTSLIYTTNEILKQSLNLTFYMHVPELKLYR